MGAKLVKSYRCVCGTLMFHSSGAFDAPPLHKKCPCGKMAPANVSAVTTSKKTRKQSSSRSESESFFDFSSGSSCDAGDSD